MRALQKSIPRTVWVAFTFLIVLSIAALLADWLSPYTFDEQVLEDRLSTPSWSHWMGTDALGRDLLTRVLFGARLSLTIGLVTGAVGLVFGTFVGIVSGWKGKWLDLFLMRATDFVSILPSTLIAILLTVFVGRGFWGIFAALVFTSWMNHARIIRGQVLLLKTLPSIEAAHALGASELRILTRHILPSLWGTIIVSLLFQIPANIMAESFLAFLGLGFEPPYSSWGTLAQDGFRAMRSYPHLILFPGLTLYFAMTAFQILGEYLLKRLQGKSQYSQNSRIEA
jgi:oligopeptide transport system permease protein